MKTQNTVWCKCIWPVEDESYSICMVCGNQLRKYKKVDEAISNDIAEQLNKTLTEHKQEIADYMNQYAPCPDCNSKIEVRSSCNTCQGKGFVIEKKPIDKVWLEESGEISDEQFESLFVITDKKGNPLSPDTKIELEFNEDSLKSSNEILMEMFENEPQTATLHFSKLVKPRKTMYAIYAQSGFYKSWKFVQVHENVFYPYVETSTAIIDFCAKWPGFTKILKMEKTDVKIYE